jgi:hypothetical protein
LFRNPAEQAIAVAMPGHRSSVVNTTYMNLSDEEIEKLLETPPQ